jgi:predicted ester cyclase
MSAEKNKAIVCCFFDEVGNKGNLAAIDEFVAPSFVSHNSRTGLTSDRDGFKQTWGMFRSVFPDFHTTVDDAIAEGDKVALYMTNYGTHQGEFLGVPPTHKQVAFKGMLLFRVVNEKLVERWGVLDMYGLLQQFGALPLI